MWLQALNAGQRLVTGETAERYAEDRDKLGVSLRIFDAPMSQPWQRPASDEDPYTVGLAELRSATTEADAIAHDAGVVSGFQRMFENMPDTRQDLKIFYSEEADRRTGRRRVLQTLNVNATGIEAVTGGDLLYYHLRPGGSLQVDEGPAHGPDQLVVLPIRLLSVTSYADGRGRWRQAARVRRGAGAEATQPPARGAHIS